MTLPEGYIVKQLLSNTSTMQTHLAESSNKEMVVIYSWPANSIQFPVEAINPDKLIAKSINNLVFSLSSDEYTLTELLAEKSLSIDNAFTIAIAISKSLAQIHATGTFLGTISPENIVWNANTKTIRFLWKAKTTWHFECVNWLYCSPEQSGRITAEADYRSDFYSFGLLLHTMFLHHHPFEDVKLKIMMRIHITRQVKLPVSAAIFSIINTLLEKQVQNRYQSAIALLSDLILAQELYINKVADTGFRPMRKFADVFKPLIYANCFIREKYSLVDSLKTLATEHTALVTLEASDLDGRSAFLRDMFSLLSRQSICYLQVFPNKETSDIPFYVVGLLLKELIHYYRNGDTGILAKCRLYVLSLPITAQQILLCLCPDFSLIGLDRPIVPGSEINDNAMVYTVLRDFIRFSNSLTRPMVIYIESPQWLDAASLRLFIEMHDDVLIKDLIFLRFSDDVSKPHFLSGKRLVTASFALPKFSVKQLTDALILNYNIPNIIASQLAEACMEKTNGSFDSTNAYLAKVFESKLVHFHNETHKYVLNGDLFPNYDTLTDREHFSKYIRKMISSETQNMLQWAAVAGICFDFSVLMQILTVDENTLHRWLNEAVATGIIEIMPHYHSLNNERNRLVYRFSCSMMRENFLPSDSVDFKRRSNVVLNHYVSLIHHHDGILWAGLLLENKTLWAECNQEKQYHILQFIHQLAKRLTFFIKHKDAERLNSYCFSLLKPISWLDRYYLSKEIYHLAYSLACSSGSFERADYLYNVVKEAIKDESEIFSFHLLKIENAIERGQLETARSIAHHLLQNHSIESASVGSIWSRVVAGFKEKLFDNKLFNDEIAVSTADETIADHILSEINLLSYKHLDDVYEISIGAIIQRVAYQGIKDCYAMPLLYYSQQLITSGNNIDKGIKLAQIIHQYIFNNPELQRQKTLFYIIYILPFVAKITTSIKTLKASIKEALIAGDHKTAHFLATHFIIHQFLSGSSITAILREIQETKQLMPQISKSVDFYNFITIAENRSRAIAEIHYKFDEGDLLTSSGDKISYWNDLTLLLYFYYKGDYEKALISAENAQRKSVEIETQTNTYLLDLYQALTILELCSTYGEKRQNEVMDYVGRILVRFKNYSKACPENFEHKYWLLNAMWHQTRGEIADAMSSYKKAIAMSELHYFRNICGLARYKLAKLQLAAGDSDKAKRNILHAYNNFLLFGAQTISQRIKLEHFTIFEDIEINIYNIE